MLIGLDARTIYTDCRRGTGKNLINLYRAVNAQRPAWRTCAYHRAHPTSEPVPPLPQLTPRRIEMVGDRVDAWGRWSLPLAAWRDGVDVLHCPANLCASWMPLPTVVTIHDLIPLDLPEGRDPIQRRRFEQSVGDAVRHAAAIICPSHYTRNRILDRFDADPQRTAVIPWAPDASMHHRPESACRDTLVRYGVRSPFVLHLGAAGPRKNTHRLIHAWHDVDRRLRHHWQLLVVGLDPAFRFETQELVDDLDLSGFVQVHGFAPEADLPALFSSAAVLAHPTLAEGFGLPLLDAFVTRTAVLSSAVSSIPEIADDAALLVNPSRSEEITVGLESLMASTPKREVLIQRGLRRLADFSWSATAQRFITLFESVARRDRAVSKRSMPAA